jgi:peptidoglycan/LPS O-acetylase OafA/YrhL
MQNRVNERSWRWLLSILYGLLVIWTGLWNGIIHHAFKPNSFWFCLATGILAIAAGFLFRKERRTLASLVGLVSCGLVLAYYLFTFVSNPEEDATIRVGIVIVASIGQLVTILLPQPPDSHESGTK